MKISISCILILTFVLSIDIQAASTADTDKNSADNTESTKTLMLMVNIAYYTLVDILLISIIAYLLHIHAIRKLEKKMKNMVHPPVQSTTPTPTPTPTPPPVAHSVEKVELGESYKEIHGTPEQKMARAMLMKELEKNRDKTDLTVKQIKFIERKRKCGLLLENENQFRQKGTIHLSSMNVNYGDILDTPEVEAAAAPISRVKFAEHFAVLDIGFNVDEQDLGTRTLGSSLSSSILTASIRRGGESQRAPSSMEKLK